MKKILFTLFLLFASLDAEIKWIEYEDALIQAKKENKTIMIMIGRSTCSVCTYMKDVVFKDKNVLAKLNSNFLPVYLELDFDEVPEGLTWIGVPTFYFLDKNKKTIYHIDGGKRTPSFIQALDEVH